MATIEEVLSETSSGMTRSVDALKRELGAIRTGRASPTLVESLMVDYYGVPTPLNQLATISIPEARVIMIQPWDKQAMSDVEKGILKSDLGLMPNNDGTVIRINIPMPTEERRRELVKLVSRKVEEALVSVRNVRRDSLEQFRKMEREKDISQDDGRRAQDQLQGITDSYGEQMNALKAEKEAEVMEV
ncbi:MAG: ribosome recycling factor [Chloroflexi bacterium]|nr:ribosome recycling factor [Chloroflexota bacterium]